MEAPLTTTTDQADATRRDEDEVGAISNLQQANSLNREEIRSPIIEGRVAARDIARSTIFHR